MLFNYNKFVNKLSNCIVVFLLLVLKKMFYYYKVVNNYFNSYRIKLFSMMLF